MSDQARSAAAPRPSLSALDSQALVQRREALLARSAALRERMAVDASGLAAPLRPADRVLDALRWVRAHPALPALGAAVVVLWRPRRAWRWAVRGWTLWRGWQRLRRLVRR